MGYASARIDFAKIACGIILAFIFAFFASALNPNQNTQKIRLFSSQSIDSNPLANYFIPNQGQLDKQVGFYAQLLTGDVYITRRGELVYSFYDEDKTTRWSVVETPLNAAVNLTAAQAAQTQMSFFLQDDAESNGVSTSTYQVIRSENLWPGIQMDLHLNAGRVEKYFTLAPGVKVEQIKFKLAGVNNPRISEIGELTLPVGIGQVSFSKPVAWQIIGGQKIPVDVEYVLNDNEYGFHLGAYDKKFPVVIDPLIQSTFLGGSGFDQSLAMAVHPLTGEVYVAGSTTSLNFPGTTGGAQAARSGNTDAYVARLSPDLKTLLQSTYLGGSGNDLAGALAIHFSTGHIYIAGTTTSTNFPVTPGAAQTTSGGFNDAFIVHLSDDLTSLQQSTYLGGNGFDADLRVALAIHPQTSELYITGRTTSVNFPGIAGTSAAQATMAGQSDSFVARLSSDLSSLSQATYLGGLRNDYSTSLAIHSVSGEVYVAGLTFSNNFPNTLNGAQVAYAGNSDGFVTKLNAGLTTILQSSYLGGSGNDADFGAAIVLSSDTSEVYLAGRTASVNFPGTTLGAQSTPAGGGDGFIALLSDDLTTLKKATYLGGSRNDMIDSITLHGILNEVYVAGRSSSLNFPTFANSIQPIAGGNWDAIVARLSADLSTLNMATYLGGVANDTDPDQGALIAFHHDTGDVYVTGSPVSVNFPNTVGGAQPGLAGASDVFIAHLDYTLSTDDAVPNGFSFATLNEVVASTWIESESVTISGINVPTPIKISGGEYRIGNEPYTSIPSTISNNEVVTVRVMSSATQGVASTATLTIGATSATFSVITAGADTTPDAFSFVDQVDVERNIAVISSNVTISGISTSAPVSISGGEYSIDGATYTSAPGTVANGQSITLRVISSNNPGTTVSATLIVGGVSATFNVTTVVLDTVPDPFTFVDKTSVAQNTLIVSDPVVITGLTGASLISITGGEYNINSGVYTATSGNVNNNDVISVRVISASAPDSTRSATVTIGGVSDTFSVTTTTLDTTPDAFMFVDQFDVPMNVTINSNVITISGINSSTEIAISGGEYSINGGALTSAPGTINNNQTVMVQLISAANPGITTDAVLTVGGVSDTFSVTTAAGDITPDPFNFIDQTNVGLATLVTSNPIVVTGITGNAPVSIFGGSYSINSGAFTTLPGTVSAGQSILLQILSASTPGVTRSATLTIGGVFDTFNVTTSAIVVDTVPDPFHFTDQENVPFNTRIISDTVTISGINATAALSVLNGEYSINGGEFTSAPGAINNNETVRLRVLSANAPNSIRVATLYIGGVADNFSVLTGAAVDTVPDPFVFTDQTGVQLNTLITSNQITVTGIEASTTISIVGGEYSIDNAAFTSAQGQINNGQKVTVRVMSPATNNATANVVVSIGGVSDTFSVTTLVAGNDTTPDAFTFTDQSAVPLASVITSNAILVSGIDAPASISIVGGEYSINGGTFTSAAGQVSSGQQVVLRVTSAATAGNTVIATLTIGGVSDTFTVTSANIVPDTVPDVFSLIDQIDVATNTQIESAAITVTGINSPSAISITGGEYKIDSGSYTTLAGTVNNMQQVKVRVTSSASANTTVNAVLTIGGISDTFSVTTSTSGLDTTPNVFIFTDVTGVALNTQISSQAIVISGIDAPATVTIIGGEYSINNGAFASTQGVVNNGEQIVVRLTSSMFNGITTDATLSVGGVSDTFSVTTTTISPKPSSSSSSSNCFIATAAYGSFLEPEVMVLRQFRDQYLLTNGVGARLVEFYYENSPPIANYIRERNALRAITRWVLTPLVYVIKYPLSLLGILLLTVVLRERRLWL